MPVDERDLLLVAFKSEVACSDGGGDALGRHGPHFDGGVIRARSDHVWGERVEVDVEHLAFVALQHVRHGLDAPDSVPFSDEDAAAGTGPRDGPE